MKSKNYPKTHYENFEVLMNERGVSVDEVFDERTLESLYLNRTVSDKPQINYNTEEFFRSTLSAMYNFRLGKKKVFRFTDDLSRLLFFTDLTSVDASTFRVPESSFYINGFGCLNIRTHLGILIDGVYVTAGTTNDLNSEAMERMKSYYENKFGIKYNGDILHYIGFLFVREEIKADNEKGADEFFIPFLLTEGDVLVQLNTMFDRYINSSAYPAEHRELIVTLMKFIVNCILYLNSDNVILEKIRPVDQVSGKKSAKKIKKAIKHSGTRLDTILVGGNIHIERRTREYLEKAMPGRKNERRTPNWLVLGHWHGYWMKVDNIKETDWKTKRVRKLNETRDKALVNKWLMPYVKGEKDEEIPEKEYAVR